MWKSVILTFWIFFCFQHEHMQLSCESALHLRYWPSGGRNLFPFSAPGFEFSCARLSLSRCLTWLLSLQNVQWAVGLVMVRASWPEHPHRKKKKKKKGCESGILKCLTQWFSSMREISGLCKRNMHDGFTLVSSS
jgi:hypothetical protein